MPPTTDDTARVRLGFQRLKKKKKRVTELKHQGFVLSITKYPPLQESQSIKTKIFMQNIPVISYIRIIISVKCFSFSIFQLFGGS